MTKEQIDPETNDYYPPFGVEGGTFSDVTEQYKKVNRQANLESDAMYLIKANAPINTEAHTYAQTQMSSGKVRFLVDEMQAKNRLMKTKVGQEMDSDRRSDYLQPFTLTTILKEQLLNLKEENEGINIILKQSSKAIPKDKFSSFEYALLYIKRREEKKKKRSKRDLAKMVLFG